jgi:hypothetical protein
MSESFRHAFRLEHQGRFVARFGVGDCRSLGYDAVPDPLAGNPAHAVVVTDATSNRLRRMARDLRDRFVTLIEPA